LIAPSPAFLASLPGKRIPDRRDFFDFPEAERMTRWQTILDASTVLGEELHELIETGRLIDAVMPWT
jgi:hypothetical protein